MFCKGDKIVYPMYGAGIVENIEKQDVEGVQESYYVIRIPNGNLKIKVSAKKAMVVGIREVAEKGAVFSTINSVCVKPLVNTENWNQRYKENMEKIKTGKLIDIVEVVKNLVFREREKGLSGAEKKMLNSAKQIIISEIVFSQDVEKETAEELLANSLMNC